MLKLGVVHQDPDPALAKSTDRQARARPGCAVPRARASPPRHRDRGRGGGFNPRRFVMAVGLCMSIGALTGVAAALGLELYELPPKRWQGAILGRGPGAKGKIDYDEVERRLIAFLAGAGGTAAQQLAAIPAGQRNHARDACGVGVFAALRPGEATRVGATRAIVLA